MPINIDKKILFIHIPKCSGTYISRLFEMERNNFLHNSKQSSIVSGDCHVLGRTLQHYPLDMIINVINTYNVMNNKNININNYYIFTIIRNPYDRFISAYNQYPNRCNKKFSEMINNKNITDFALYLRDRVKTEGDNFFKYGPFHQFEPMIKYTKENETYHVNFIKLEQNYENKIKQLCKKYNIVYNNVKLNKNSSELDYSKYKKNKLLVECINEIYKEDFIFFNYKQINV